MKPIVKKMLESGLVEKHSAQMLERWGFLEEGAADLVKREGLEGATRDQVAKLVEEIATEVDRLRTLKETQLDLEAIRWPALVTIKHPTTYVMIEGGLSCVMDRMGRLYFRIQDVRPEWFVPGYLIERGGPGCKEISYETILESTTLFVNEQPVCVQVTTAAE